MTNAEKFKNIFGLYATELWAKSEKEFLKWLNTETQETYCENLVDRQAAIDKLTRFITPHDNGDGTMTIGILSKSSITNILNNLPPAQPEPLTDKEQRIFLSAMGREEEVCKEVDDAWRDCREPYEDNLVRTCHEITRKVKGALWT